MDIKLFKKDIQKRKNDKEVKYIKMILNKKIRILKNIQNILQIFLHLIGRWQKYNEKNVKDLKFMQAVFKSALNNKSKLTLSSEFEKVNGWDLRTYENYKHYRKNYQLVLK